jgi:hypothetical protein
MSNKLSNSAELRTSVRIDGARINSGAPLAGTGNDEQMWCTGATNATVVRCEGEASSRKVSSNSAKFTDLTKFARIAFARLNWGAPLPGVDNIQQMVGITVTNATVVRCRWDASLEEMSSKLPTLAELRKLVHIDGTRINSATTLAGAGEGEHMGGTASTNATVALCKWDASSRKVSSNFSKSTDLKKLARIAVARLNGGTPLPGADNIKRVGCITNTNATVALCEWDARLKEMSSKPSNLTELRKFVRIDSVQINSGSPLAGAGDGEQTWCTTVTNATVVLYEWDASSRRVSSKLPRARSLKKVDPFIVDERVQRYQTKGKFGGSGRNSRSRIPGKDNHETTRGSQ